MDMCILVDVMETADSFSSQPCGSGEQLADVQSEHSTSRSSWEQSTTCPPDVSGAVKQLFCTVVLIR